MTESPTVPGRSRPVSTTAYLTSRPSDTDRLRLFCFHHAGGGASAFNALRRSLEPRIELVAVQLPGREGRLGHRMPGSMAELVAELDRSLDPYLGGAYACYGHSMGALVAHDLIARRQRCGATLPVALVVGACRAPQRGTALAGHAEDTDDALIRTMLDIGGLSPELLRYPDWLHSAVVLTRTDLRICASRGSDVGEPLSCPIDVFQGADDPLVPASDALDWGLRSSVRCTPHRFEGGHFFFLRESPDEFAARLRTVLGDAVARATADSLASGS